MADVQRVPDCIFCRIASGEAPAAMVYEDDAVMAFMDLFPAAKGHQLVVPRAHFENLYELPDTLVESCFRVAARLARAARSAFGAEGVNLFQANGRAAGQEVFHFHVHVLPRYGGDGIGLIWPRQRPSREELQAVASQIRAALG